MSFVGVRLLGVGNLRPAALRRAGGDRARRGGPLAGRLPRVAGGRTGQHLEPDPFGVLRAAKCRFVVTRTGRSAHAGGSGVRRRSAGTPTSGAVAASAPRVTALGPTV